MLECSELTQRPEAAQQLPALPVEQIANRTAELRHLKLTETVLADLSASVLEPESTQTENIQSVSGALFVWPVTVCHVQIGPVQSADEPSAQLSSDQIATA